MIHTGRKWVVSETDGDEANPIFEVPNILIWESYLEWPNPPQKRCQQHFHLLVTFGAGLSCRIKLNQYRKKNNNKKNQKSRIRLLHRLNFMRQIPVGM